MAIGANMQKIEDDLTYRRWRAGVGEQERWEKIREQERAANECQGTSDSTEGEAIG